MAAKAHAPAHDKAPEAPSQSQPPTASAAAPAFAFKIRSDIPLPEKRRTGPRPETLYPFDVLDIGHSFFVPASEKQPEPWKTLTSLASRQARATFPKAFTTSRDKEDGVDGVRIWRIADRTEPLPPPKQNRRRANAEAARLAAEAAAGDTSNKRPEPMFGDAGNGGAPPPPPPAG